MSNLTSVLFEGLCTTLSEQGAYLISAPAMAGYPITTYSMITASAVDSVQPCFGEETESFRVQISVFDDGEDLDRLLSTLGDIETALADKSAWGMSLVRLRKLGTMGPTWITDDRHWQLICDYEITLSKSTLSEGETDDQD